jgi:hypothetical protein
LFHLRPGGQRRTLFGCKSNDVSRLVHLLLQLHSYSSLEVCGKLPVMIKAWKQNQPYQIMPYSIRPPICSKSTPSWLILHLILATLLSFFTMLRILDMGRPIDLMWVADWIVWVQILLHILFCLLVLINLIHLVSLPKWAAVSVNLLVLALLNWILYYHHLFSYFVILTSPVWEPFLL